MLDAAAAAAAVSHHTIDAMRGLSIIPCLHEHLMPDAGLLIDDSFEKLLVLLLLLLILLLDYCYYYDYYY